MIDDALLDACRAGDAAAFRTLYDTYASRVYSIALHYLAGDDDAAAEVTQRVFVKVFDSLSRFTPGTQLGGWLYRVVVNACMDEHRTRDRHEPLHAADSVAARQPARDQIDLPDQVRVGVQRLPPKLRLAILLRYFEDLSYEEMAVAMGCSMGTVASRLSRAHSLLATNLKHLRDALG
jgi:RNA polymerase sigma-70 factor (ECF subfamily)